MATEASKPARGAVREDTHALAREVGELVTFTREAIAAAPGTARHGSEILRQLRILITGTTALMGLMCFLVGVTITTFGLYFLRSAGATDYVGLLTGIQNPRGAVVFMFGFVSAAKISCSLAAEIGTMQIADEIAGLEAEGVDPMRYTVGTRLAAVLLYMPIAAAVGLLAVNVGSYVNVVHIIGAVSPDTFDRFNWGLQTAQDQLFSFIQMASIGVAHALVGCYYGYRTRGGPEAVGRSVARCMVLNLILVFVIALFWSQVFYGTDPHVPIGG